jgi:putative sigma-54 modulation protein
MGNNKFEGQEYHLYIVGKHIEVTDAIKQYVFDKLSRIEKIADRIIDIHVVLDAQKLEQSCSILMNFIHFQVKSSASTDNMYSAIDRASDRAITLIRKYKTKLQSRRFKDLTTVDIHVNVIEPLQNDLKAINDEIMAENAARDAEELQIHKVVAKETMPLKTLTHDEAVIKMEISEMPFLIFRAEEDQMMKVIYRRDDLNYGLVQVQ